MTKKNPEFILAGPVTEDWIKRDIDIELSRGTQRDEMVSPEVGGWILYGPTSDDHITYFHRLGAEHVCAVTPSDISAVCEWTMPDTYTVMRVEKQTARELIEYLLEKRQTVNA